MRSLIAIFFLSFATTCFAVEVSDANLHFTFNLPNGFVDNPNANVNPPIIRALYLPSTTQDPMDGLFMSVSDLNGIMGRDDPSKMTLPPGVALVRTKWKSFDLYIFRKYGNINNAPTVQYVADIPLVPHAIRLTFIGKSSRENEVEALTNSTVSTVQGETNWLSVEQRAGSFLKMIYGILGTLVIALGAVVLLRKLTKKTSVS